MFFLFNREDLLFFFFFFQAEDGIRYYKVTGVQTCALPILAQVAEHHLDLQPAAAEDDGLDAGADPGRCDASRLEHRAAANAKLAIEQRRVVEDQASLAAGRAAAVDQRDVVLLEQALRELPRVGDGRGGADECRM